MPIQHLGGFAVEVDSEKRTVCVFDRSSGCEYVENFDALHRLALKWQVRFDPSQAIDEIADISFRLIMAERCIHHGLSPDGYLKRPLRLSRPDKHVIRQFEEMVDKWGGEGVLSHLRPATREALLSGLRGFEKAD